MAPLPYIEPVGPTAGVHKVRAGDWDLSENDIKFLRGLKIDPAGEQ